MVQKSKQSILRSYLLFGDDSLKKDTFVSRLKQVLSEQQALLDDSMGISFDEFDFSDSRQSMEELIDKATSLSFFSSTRLILAKGVESFSKEQVSLYCRYLENPAEDSVVVLSAQKIAKNSRLYKAFEKYNSSSLIDCATKKGKELIAMVQALGSKQGIKLDATAAKMLIDILDSDMIAINNQIKQFSLEPKRPVQFRETDVRKRMIQNPAVKPWELVDAISARKKAEALRLWSQMEGASPFALERMIENRLNELIIARSCLDEGKSFRIASILKAPSWKANKIALWAENFSRSSLMNALNELCVLEKELRQGADQNISFERFLLHIL